MTELLVGGHLGISSRPALMALEQFLNSWAELFILCFTYLWFSIKRVIVNHEWLPFIFVLKNTICLQPDWQLFHFLNLKPLCLPLHRQDLEPPDSDRFKSVSQSAESNVNKTKDKIQLNNEAETLEMHLVSVLVSRYWRVTSTNPQTNRNLKI